MVSRLEPFGGFFPVRDVMNQLLNESFVRPSGQWAQATQSISFPLDLYEAGDEIVLRVAIPGAQPDSIELTLNQGVLSLKGYRSFYSGEEEKQYRWHIRGLSEGEFQFSVSLPTAVDADAARADYDGGLLIIHLPKAETAKTKRISVGGGQKRETISARST
jgi:HSP20 family protein